MIHNKILEDFYKVLSKNETTAEIELSDKSHPVFKAHFPSRPIMPGFTHFEIVADLFDLEIQSVKRAKFSQMVTPKQILRYEKNANKFRVFCEEKEVANFIL